MLYLIFEIRNFSVVMLNAKFLFSSGDIKIASDYLTPEEAQGFKKRKRKVKKVRKTGITLMDDVLERRGFKDDPFDGSSKGSKDHGSRNFKRGDDEKDTKKEEITITEEELQAQLDAAGIYLKYFKI